MARINKNLPRQYLDPLYGKYPMNNLIYKMSFLVPLQRLRDIRLSNINSQFSGINSISRYEHSLGTAHLATILIKKLNISDINGNELIMAALLHDAASPPFGHSIEYLFKQYDSSYSHEKNISQILSGESSAELSIYGQHTQKWGLEFNIKEFIEKEKIEAEISNIKDIILGTHPLGQFLCNDIDIDNIDNVNRLLNAMGLLKEKQYIMNIINSMSYHDKRRIMNVNEISNLEIWLDNRKILYNELMNNPYDFSAKAMIFYASKIAINNLDLLSKLDWLLTDSELIEKLYSSKHCSSIIKRFKNGNLFCIENLTWIQDQKGIEKILNMKQREKIEEELSHELGKEIILYFISDKNRSEREIEINYREDNITKSIRIGKHINRLLIGIFSKDKFTKSFQNSLIVKNSIEQILEIKSGNKLDDYVGGYKE